MVIKTTSDPLSLSYCGMRVRRRAKREKPVS